jgi:hypothetical protein
MGQGSSNDKIFFFSNDRNIDIRHQTPGHKGCGSTGTAATDDYKLFAFFHDSLPFMNFEEISCDGPPQKITRLTKIRRMNRSDRRLPIPNQTRCSWTRSSFSQPASRRIPGR